MDLSNACIYKICCKDTSIIDCYVGSTTCMRRRKSMHKFCCNNENDKRYNLNVYEFIRNNGGWNNWDIILVEKVNVSDGYELKKEERKWIEQLDATLNQVIPTRTPKEYREKYKEKYKEKAKEYYETNKKKLTEYKKEWYEENKEKILEHKKNYYEVNKKELKEYQKEYRENNKEKIAEKKKEYWEQTKEIRNEKIECPICKTIIMKRGLNRHQKTIKCLSIKNKHE